MPGVTFRGAGRVCTRCRTQKPASGFKGNRVVCKACTPSTHRMTVEQRIIQRIKDRLLPNRFSNSRSQCRFGRARWLLKFEEWAPLMKMPCAYCGGKLDETGKGVDRIDNDGHYSADNVLPCCGTCNHVRSRLFTVQEMKEKLGPIIGQIKAERAAIGQKLNIYDAVHSRTELPVIETDDDRQLAMFEMVQ